ncbi:MAG: outer membrane protein OmpA-like peptidoglycan-associated protein [Saprospiraceae bacterium]|jgi:outer membrane protein OmpA-like peptidoglycan-associated protein
MKYLILSVLQLFLITSALAQSATLEGYIKDNQNNRKLNNVEITVTDDQGTPPYMVTTDEYGMYSLQLNSDVTYGFELERVAYNTVMSSFTLDEQASEKVIHNMSMQRLPGYEFQADVKELLSGGNGADKRLGHELKNLKIEIYNNTLGKEIRVTEDDPKNTFEVNFERGNHYTILIRKKGFFAKRIEVNVDIFGCILCFEGLGNDYAPEIEAATGGTDRGILIADIPMKRIVKDETIRLDNIYYDYDKWNIRPDARPALDNLVQILKRNPIIIELGSHTDSRGKDEYNMTLSDKRAKSAVDYIVSRGVKVNRITAKGYGETIPLNNCTDGVACSDEEYQFNRRTEFKVTGFLEETNFAKKTLKQILEEEKISKKRLKEQIEGI